MKPGRLLLFVRWPNIKNKDFPDSATPIQQHSSYTQVELALLKNGELFILQLMD